MLNLPKEQMTALAEAIRQENGANSEEVSNIMKRILTVGDLKKVLSLVDDSLPVELEVVVEITNEGDCSTQPGLAIHHYQVQNDDSGFARFTLVGAQPQNAEAYAEAFELDINRQ